MLATVCSIFGLSTYSWTALPWTKWIAMANSERYTIEDVQRFVWHIYKIYLWINGIAYQVNWMVPRKRLHGNCDILNEQSGFVIPTTGEGFYGSVHLDTATFE